MQTEVSDFKTARRCLTGSIILQCGLSAGKQKFSLILVKRNSMQVTKGTWHIHEQCIPGSLPSSLAREPGNEATSSAKENRELGY